MFGGKTTERGNRTLILDQHPYDRGRIGMTASEVGYQRVREWVRAQRALDPADRSFPREVLFAHLRQGGTAFSIRLRLSDWMTVAGVYAVGADYLEAGRLVDGQWTAATAWAVRPAPRARLGRGQHSSRVAATA